jgi:hypothetical protein
MLQTGSTVIPITNNQTIDLENVTSVQIITGETNNQRIFVNGVPLIDRIENILPSDGTICPILSLSIEFKENLIPTGSPVCLIYLRIRKLLEKKCANNGE